MLKWIHCVRVVLEQKKLKESHGSRILYGLKLSVRGRITIGKHWNAEREVDCLIYRVVVFEQITLVVSALCNFLNPCQFVEHQSILKVSASHMQNARSSSHKIKYLRRARGDFFANSIWLACINSVWDTKEQSFLIVCVIQYYAQ